MNELTFVEKFSKFKLKFFIFFWIFSILYILWISASSIHTLISINKLSNSYFNIEIKNGHAEYLQNNNKPSEWSSLSEISKKLQYAIIVSEDGKFFNHPGIDIEQLNNAINDSFVKHKKKKRGASTITQQMVKNLYLEKDRTFLRKFVEILLSFYVESRTAKLKILEIYLNIIEYGKDLYGIKNASRFYFNKSPHLLSARESAFIAMLLPSPKKYSISFHKKCLTPFARKIIDSILLKMRQGGYIGDDEFARERKLNFSWESCLGSTVLDPASSEENLENVDE